MPCISTSGGLVRQRAGGINVDWLLLRRKRRPHLCLRGDCGCIPRTRVGVVLGEWFGEVSAVYVGEEGLSGLRVLWDGCGLKVLL